MRYFKKKMITSVAAMLLLGSYSLEAQLFGTKVKRYKSFEVAQLNNSTQHFVCMSTHKTLVEEPVTLAPPQTLWTLDGEGQAELIKLYSGKLSKLSEIEKELQSEFFKRSSQLRTDYTLIDIRLIISIEKAKRILAMNLPNGDFSLADRIAYLSYSFTVDTEEIIFEKWDKYETEYRTYNIANISNTNSLSLTGGFSATSATSKTSAPFADSASVTPSLSATTSNSVTEAQAVGNRNLEFNGRISDSTIEIEQEGSRDIDLTGNVAVEAQLRFTKPSYEDVSVFNNLFTGGVANEPTNVTLNIIEVKIPNRDKAHEDIEAILNAEYWYRHVSNKKGRNTFFEWDDKVKMYVGNIANQSETLLRVKDYLPNFLNLKIKDPKSQKEDYLRLKKVSDGETKNAPRVIFSDYTAADGFRSWLNQLVYNGRQELIKLQKALEASKKTKKKAIIAKAQKALDAHEAELKKAMVFGKYHELQWNRKALTVMELIQHPKERIRFERFFETSNQK